MKMLKRFVVVLISAALFMFWYFSPLFNNLPRPTGPYCVGYECCDWYDDQSSKEINAEIFYPSARPKKEETFFPYQLQKMAALAKVKAQGSLLPEWVWTCLLGNIFSYAEPNAAISHNVSDFPVIFYLPGIGGEDLHNVVCENLASHGYVVCAIIPAGDIVVTIPKDGTIIPLNQILQEAMQKVDRDAIYAYRNHAHVRWVSLIEATIRKLTELNNDTASQFYHMIDMHRLGMIGHSHGGAVVTDFCQKNKVCKAGINMDGWTKTYNSDARFETPFLFMLGNIKDMPEIQSFIKNNENRSDFIVVAFDELGHEAFTDYSMIKQPVGALLGIKPIVGGNDSIAQEKNMIVRFFDTYL